MIAEADYLNQSCLAISGGVGGAKLALGLSKLLAPEKLTIVANTGDDFQHFGLTICPDLDTVMYTLADLNNKSLGWGQVDESWNFLGAMEKLGGESWFNIGDRDLATHLHRQQLLDNGCSLTEVTERLCRALGVENCLVPMSDMQVSTKVRVVGGETLAFQHYFVRDRCEPVVSGFEFSGAANAKPSPRFVSALETDGLGCILFCPSNPFVSIDPVLAIPTVLTLMQVSNAPVIAVSPIVNGIAIKGPAAKMMQELGMPQTALSIAKHYQGKIDGFVIDVSDSELQREIEALGMQVLVTDTMMHSLESKVELARVCLAFASKIRK